MVKELTPQQLREFGFPELAYGKEPSVSARQEGAAEGEPPLSKTATKEERSESSPKPSDSRLDSSQYKNGLVESGLVLVPKSVTPLTPLSVKNSVLKQFKVLLSPLLSPLLKGKDGLVDIKKIPAKNFEEFKNFLKAQLSVDGRAFNDFGFLDGMVGKGLDEITDLFASYQRVIDRKELEPLLRLLYEEKTGRPSEEESKEEGTLVSLVGKKRLDSLGHRNPSLLPAGMLMAFKPYPVGAPLSDHPEEVGQTNLPLSQLLKQFTKAWIHVSAGMFVGHLIASQAGREMIGSVLKDGVNFDLDTRADVVKGVASQGQAHGVGGLNEYLLTQNISTANLFNIRIWDSIKQGKIVKVSEGDLEKASVQALEILGSAEWAEQKAEEEQDKYFKAPENIRALVGITPEQIKTMAALISTAPPLQAKLASFWLMIADSDHLMEARYATYENRHLWLKKIEGFLEKSKNIHDAASYLELNEEILDFLSERIEIKNHGTLNHTTQEKIDNFVFHTVDFVSGHTLKDVFAGVPSPLQAPFAELNQYVEEIHYVSGEDERFYTDPTRVEATDPQIRGEVSGLIEGLQQARRGMWHSYNQRVEVSQIGSWFYEKLSLGYLGDKARIRDATEAIDESIDRLIQAHDKAAVETEKTHILGLLEEGNALFEGMKASEFDGVQQLTQLVQTIGEIALTTVVLRGVGMAAKLAEAANLLKGQRLFQGEQLTSYLVRSGKFTQFQSLYELSKAGGFAEIYKTVQVSEQVGAMSEGLFALNNSKFTRWIAQKGAEVHWGLKMGALNPLEENLLSKLCDRVGSRDSEVFSMARDSISTSLAMGFFTPLAMLVGEGMGQGIFRGMMRRYLGARGVMHFMWDNLVEFGEELVDQSTNLALGGRGSDLNADQIRDIGIVSFAGGGTKMGMVAEGFKQQSLQAKSAAPEPQGPNSIGGGIVANFTGWFQGMASVTANGDFLPAADVMDRGVAMMVDLKTTLGGILPPHTAVPEKISGDKSTFYQNLPLFLGGAELAHYVSGDGGNQILASMTNFGPEQGILGLALSTLAILGVLGKNNGDKPSGNSSEGEAPSVALAKSIVIHAQERQWVEAFKAINHLKTPEEAAAIFAALVDSNLPQDPQFINFIHAIFRRIPLSPELEALLEEEKFSDIKKRGTAFRVHDSTPPGLSASDKAYLKKINTDYPGIQKTFRNSNITEMEKRDLFKLIEATSDPQALFTQLPYFLGYLHKKGYGKDKVDLRFIYQLIHATGDNALEAFAHLEEPLQRIGPFNFRSPEKSRLILLVAEKGYAEIGSILEDLAKQLWALSKIKLPGDLLFDLYEILFEREDIDYKKMMESISELLPELVQKKYKPIEILAVLEDHVLALPTVSRQTPQKPKWQKPFSQTEAEERGDSKNIPEATGSYEPVVVPRMRIPEILKNLPDPETPETDIFTKEDNQPIEDVSSESGSEMKIVEEETPSPFNKVSEGDHRVLEEAWLALKKIENDDDLPKLDLEVLMAWGRERAALEEKNIEKLHDKNLDEEQWKSLWKHLYLYFFNLSKKEVLGRSKAEELLEYFFTRNNWSDTASGEQQDFLRQARTRVAVQFNGELPANTPISKIPAQGPEALLTRWIKGEPMDWSPELRTQVTALLFYPTFESDSQGK